MTPSSLFSFPLKQMHHTFPKLWNLEKSHMIGKDMSFDEAEAAVAAHDSDNDGLLDFDDFMRLVGPKKRRRAS
ncbi:hypothetical protein K7X08_032713 [Anisodus acutangulus]|uniref:EF-hand domain-containing protein n=1 Tax=Anisodus acutangulus TaxID=402998 RepID=A0A9Q1M2X1_9SOLA|nr:hypothetical protein K7X08_032713 [Anisodus acutangulus]